MKKALSAVWRHKRFFALQAAGVAAWVALALSWFWLPDSAVWALALAAVQAAAIVAAAVFLIRAALRYYGKNQATGSAGGAVVPRIALLAVIGAAAPWLLISWRPELPGVAAQTASLLVRFGLAFLIAVTAYLAIMSLLAAARSRSS
jgi:hypothetical protein